MEIKKLDLQLKADPKKVVLQFYPMKKKKIKKILNRITSLNEEQVEKKLDGIYSEFSNRHKNFEECLFNNFKKVEKYIPHSGTMSSNMKQLIGAYFSKEYSIESAALFNPSIVPHPDQNGVGNNHLKFVMSLRATGEGHISSVEFREGIISDNGDVELINDSPFKTIPAKEEFTFEELKNKKFPNDNSYDSKIRKGISKNYRCSFNNDSLLSERVLFPRTKSELMGMEDPRFVKFDSENNYKYFATYTAFNGRTYKPQIIETNDFKDFVIGTIHGKMVKDKGMALFPRKVNGKYLITSRQDGENLYIMESDNLYKWDHAEKLHTPQESWGFVQLGNCGSPIETEEGWLLLTHAVGPLRKYVISAILLDLDKPYKIKGILKEPLLEPDETERDGYVPNVVYSCGSLIHNNYLVIPYAKSDSACGFAKIEFNKLLQKFH